MLQSGVRLLQIRHKQGWTRAAIATGDRVANLCAKHGARLIVNDRADVAAMLSAGVHVGQDDLAPEMVRRVVGDRVAVGFSTHNEEQMRDAQDEPVDYVAFGPVFATTSKDKADAATGLEGLARARALTARPLVAIGGITRSRAAEVFAAGADAVAVIADAFPEPGAGVAGLRTRTEEWLRICG